MCMDMMVEIFYPFLDQCFLPILLSLKFSYVGTILLVLSSNLLQRSCVASSKFRTDAGFGQEVEPDSFSGLGSFVRCSKSKLSTEQHMSLYTWEVDGFLDYLKYLRDFGAKEFTHHTANISFESEKINGDWTFEIRSNGQETFIKVIYHFTETSDNENANFGIKLKILQHFETIELPIQKPTSIQRERIHYGAAVKDKEKVSSSSYLFLYSQSSEEQEASIVEHKVLNTVIMKFNWPSISIDKFLEFQNPNSEITFAFLIHGFFPKDTKTMKKTTCSLENLENKYVQAGMDNTPRGQPPTNTIKAAFQSSSFSDYSIRVEDQDIPVHGVILYYSSPVFAAAVENATQVNPGLNADNDFVNNSHSLTSSGSVNRPIILIDNDIGYNATLEMLRYIYTRRVEHLAEFADRIIVGAERYQLPQLKAICEKFLMPNVNLTNVIDNYILGISVNSSRLIRKCFGVIQMNRAHLARMSSDFQKLSTKYPNLIFDLLTN